MKAADIEKARSMIAEGRAIRGLDNTIVRKFLDGWSRAIDALELEIKLHELAQRAMRSANQTSKDFEALAVAYFDAKEPLEAIAEAARAYVLEYSYSHGVARNAEHAPRLRSSAWRLTELRRALERVHGLKPGRSG